MDISGYFRIHDFDTFQDISGYFRIFQDGCFTYPTMDISGYFRIHDFDTFQDISGHFSTVVSNIGLRIFQDNISGFTIMPFQDISGYFRTFQDLRVTHWDHVLVDYDGAP